MPQWPAYYPPYDSPQGWEIEKLEAQIDAYDRMLSLNDSAMPDSENKFKLISNSLQLIKARMEANERIFEICRDGIFSKALKPRDFEK